MPEHGALVQMLSPRGKRYMIRVGVSDDLHTNDGYIRMSAIESAQYGEELLTHLGKPYKLLKPTLYDLVKGVKRQTQIIYPKEIGYICIKLGVGPGVRIIEAGSGSGSLTTAFSWFAGPEGRVYTYERREEFLKLCRRNLEWAGVGENVEQFNHDIADGFLQTNADCLFLDVRTPWDYLDAAAKAVMPGAPLGFLLPTTNQVSQLLEGLEQGPFAGVEVLEILVRHYKPVAERLRPDDRMVAHTGFLVFARQEEKRVPQVTVPEAVSEILPESLPENADQESISEEVAPETPEENPEEL